ncbi:hypothetical protein IWX75_000203 [Arthrobacter sp. CAN_A6]
MSFSYALISIFPGLIESGPTDPAEEYAQRNGIDS